MKKTLFFLLVLVTFYFAGMYHSRPLLAAALIEVQFLVMMFLVLWIFRKNLSVSFRDQSLESQEQEEIPCEVQVFNHSRLPVNYLEVQARVKSCFGQRLLCRQRLTGGGVQGENRLCFWIQAQLCGLYQVHLWSLEIRDYIALFSVNKKLSEEVELAVFPREYALHLEVIASRDPKIQEWEDRSLLSRGEDPYEIRQIRQYQQGDPWRSIHWNQSARGEEIWVKEYEQETDRVFYIVLSTACQQKVTMERLSACYRILSALILGLLPMGMGVVVCWRDEQRQEQVSKVLTCKEDCREFLFLLYHHWYCIEGDQEERQDGRDLPQVSDPGALLLDLNLHLYQDQTLVEQFDIDRLEEQLEENWYRIA